MKELSYLLMLLLVPLGTCALSEWNLSSFAKRKAILLTNYERGNGAENVIDFCFESEI